MTVEIRINNSSVSFRNLRRRSGIDRFESIRFDTDYQTIIGNESVGLYVDDILIYEGKIIDQSEKEDGIIEVSSIDKTWGLKKRQVPYTEYAFNDEKWNSIIKRLVEPYRWLDTSMLYPTVINKSHSNWSLSGGSINISIVSEPRKYFDGSLKLTYDTNYLWSYYYHNVSYDLSNVSNWDFLITYYTDSLDHFNKLVLVFYDSNSSSTGWEWTNFSTDNFYTIKADSDSLFQNEVDWANIRTVEIRVANYSIISGSDFIYVNLIGGNIGTNQSTIPYIHFVHDDIQNAIRTTADMVGRYCYIDHENSRFITTKRGEINVSGEVIQKYIGSIEWETEYSDIYNFIYVKGGRENGSAENDYITEFSYDGESFVKYGMSEYKPHVDEELINRSTCKLMADYLRDKYKDPRINGRIRNVPYQSDFIPGYTVNVSGTLHDGEYLIQSVDTDFEDMTCDLVLSNSPVTIENEIRDIKNSIELLKRHVVPLYTDGKPIYVEMETMRRDSSLNISETFNSNFIFGDNFGSLWGGLRKDYDTIHKV